MWPKSKTYHYFLIFVKTHLIESTQGIYFTSPCGNQLIDNVWKGEAPSIYFERRLEELSVSHKSDFFSTSFW